MGEKPKPPEKKTYSTWSAAQEATKAFITQHALCQKRMSECRLNSNLLPVAFDSVHELYRVIIQYCEDKTELNKLDLELRQKMSLYYTSSPSFKRNNFNRFFDTLDTYFTKITEAAVQKRFFPTIGKEHTIDDAVSAMRLR
jgi:ATP-dependent Clp protease ATP-binding subunit ClpA